MVAAYVPVALVPSRVQAGRADRSIVPSLGSVGRIAPLVVILSNNRISARVSREKSSRKPLPCNSLGSRSLSPRRARARPDMR